MLFCMTRGTGQNLFRKWRDHFQLTQDQVAERANLPKSTISKLENGKLEYTKGHLEALAHAYGIDPSDLIGRLPGAPHELTLLINKIPPENRDAAIAVLKALTKVA